MSAKCKKTVTGQTVQDSTHIAPSKIVKLVDSENRMVGAGGYRKGERVYGYIQCECAK